MDIKEIKTLTNLMVEHDLSEIMIRDGEKRILLRRGERGVPHAAAPMAVMTPVPAPGADAQAHQTAAAASPPVVEKAEDANLGEVASPMVGTYYSSPDPDSPPYVKIGDTVTPDTVVCIIEAMKVFNEIKAEVSGTIQSIDVKSGDPVEFGQVIMTVQNG